MNSRERVLAAMKREDVDHVPFMPFFWGNTHPQGPWTNEEERFAYYARREWDAHVWCGVSVSPSPEAKWEFHYETDGDRLVLHQVWRTPARTIEERLLVTDDWPEAKDRKTPMWFEGDFRCPRLLEVPFKEPADLDALPYLFQIEDQRDFDGIRANHPAAQRLAKTYGLPTMVYFVAGMDWLTYLYPTQELILRMVDNREMMERLVRHINEAYMRRLEVLLELGVDVVLRRALYETCDFWNPTIFAEIVAPLLAPEIEMTHRAGAVHLLEMMSGFRPLLPQMALLPFDCLSFFDPVHGGLDPDLSKLRRALPGKSFRAGLSGPAHLHRGTPASVEAAVEKAFREFGSRGFILSHAGAIRSHWSWENVEAADRAWRRLRGVGS